MELNRLHTQARLVNSENPVVKAVSRFVFGTSLDIAKKVEAYVQTEGKFSGYRNLDPMKKQGVSDILEFLGEAKEVDDVRSGIAVITQKIKFSNRVC